MAFYYATWPGVCQYHFSIARCRHFRCWRRQVRHQLWLPELFGRLRPSHRTNRSRIEDRHCLHSVHTEERQQSQGSYRSPHRGPPADQPEAAPASEQQPKLWRRSVVVLHLDSDRGNTLQHTIHLKIFVNRFRQESLEARRRTGFVKGWTMVNQCSFTTPSFSLWCCLPWVLSFSWLVVNFSPSILVSTFSEQYLVSHEKRVMTPYLEFVWKTS